MKFVFDALYKATLFFIGIVSVMAYIHTVVFVDIYAMYPLAESIAGGVFLFFTVAAGAPVYVAFRMQNLENKEMSV